MNLCRVLDLESLKTMQAMPSLRSEASLPSKPRMICLVSLRVLPINSSRRGETKKVQPVSTIALVVISRNFPR